MERGLIDSLLGPPRAVMGRAKCRLGTSGCRGWMTWEMRETGLRGRDGDCAVIGRRKLGGRCERERAKPGERFPYKFFSCRDVCRCTYKERHRNNDDVALPLQSCRRPAASPFCVNMLRWLWATGCCAQLIFVWSYTQLSCFFLNSFMSNFVSEAELFKKTIWQNTNSFIHG
jgi:hypothetical protein